MKFKVGVGVLFFLIPLLNSLQAQDSDDPTNSRDFLISDVSSVSGFGGPLIEFSFIDGEFAASFGGGGALLLNQELFFGGYGYSVSNSISQVDNTGNRTSLDFDHGGLWMGYIIDSDYLVHWVISSKFGWGNLTLNEADTDNELFSDDIFVFEPEGHVEVNINYWFKVKAGLGLRVVAGADNDFYQNDDLLSPTGSISFLFGWFKD